MLHSLVGQQMVWSDYGICGVAKFIGVLLDTPVQ